MRIRFFFLSAFLAAALLSGCGDTTSNNERPDYAKALAGSPPRLAALHAQANELLGEGDPEPYERRIESLRGFPVVVNVWASWCGPCRFEFPHFQRAAARHGKRVAFLGIDSEDSVEFATKLLDEMPVPYPSYVDPDKDIGAATDIPRGLPNTLFYDRAGQLVSLKQGPYDSQEELEADIRRYALGGGGAEGG